jgi:hypothetical protein
MSKQCQLTDSAVGLAIWMSALSGFVFGMTVGAFLFQKLTGCGG